MKEISQAFAELINLVNAAKHHRQNCVDPSCNVALLQLRWTTERLLPLCWSGEQEEARSLIENNDWT